MAEEGKKEIDVIAQDPGVETGIKLCIFNMCVHTFGNTSHYLYIRSEF